MKVKELKEILETVDDDVEVILAIDPEGNGFHVCKEYEFTGFRLEGNLVEVGTPTLEPDRDGVEFDECLILWP